MRIHTNLAIAAGGLLAAAILNTGTPYLGAAQQHSYTPQQIEEGRTLYDANCGRCHGENGAGIAGTELFKQIRRANSDDDLAKLIQTGIPETTMPPQAFTNDQAMSVVAFLRSMVGATPASAGAPAGRGSDVVIAGDAARGMAVFTGKGGCMNCHRAEGGGGTSGPDLSAAGIARGRGAFAAPPNPAALAQSILDPNADINPAFRMFQVTPKAGGTIRGRLMNQDTFSVQLLDEAQNLRGFLKSDLKDFGFLPSPMPSYRGRLTDQEVADVVSYLLTLKG